MGKDKEIGQGDLVLIPHYFTGNENGDPGKYILASFDSFLKGQDPYKDAFYFQNVRILFSGQKCGLPNTTDTYNGIQYLISAPSTISGGRDRLSINRGETFVGLEEILPALRRSPGYELHARVLELPR